MREGGRIQIVNMTHLAVQAGFHIFPVDLNIVYKVSDKNVFSVHLLSDWGRR
jgi:hypothetical protein